MQSIFVDHGEMLQPICLNNEFLYIKSTLRESQ